MREAAFNWKHRESLLSGLPSRYDMVVIGAGIAGCGIAVEAARRGYRVLLLDKGDIGSGTSSRSSRLIHGGLRYLKHGRLKLVWEASQERYYLRRLYPHLVQPLTFLIPFYEGEGEGPIATILGLWLYDALAAFRSLGHHRRLSRDEVLAEEPRLRREGLLGGATYMDCKVDDFQLVLLNAKMAHRAGADILTYCRVISLLRDGFRVTGVRFRDELDGGEYEVTSSIVANAAGPWIDEVRRMASAKGRRVRPTKGIHILLPREKVGNRQAVVMRSPSDGRVVFALPWQKLTLVGTTDTDFEGNPDEVVPEVDDVDYLIEAVNHTFPGSRISHGDVISSYAALRPLMAEFGMPASEVTRDYRIIREAPGLISVVGGKLTTYRRMARRAVDVASKGLRPSANLGQAGGSVEMPAGSSRTRHGKLVDSLEVMRLEEDVAKHIASTYGAEVHGLLPHLQDDGMRRRIVEGLPYIMGQVAYAVEDEMALRLSDVLIRRTRIAYEDPDHGLRVATSVASVMAQQLGWDEGRLRQELKGFEEAIGYMKTLREGAHHANYREP